MNGNRRDYCPHCPHCAEENSLARESAHISKSAPVSSAGKGKNNQPEVSVRVKDIASAFQEKPSDDHLPATGSAKRNSFILAKREEPKAALLFSPFKGNVLHDQAGLLKAESQFDPQKPLVVIVAAGILGTGKSTWLNSFLYEFGVTSAFKVGSTQVTETEGIWLYPYPLIHPSTPDVQFLLLDMEGMGGLRPGESRDVTRQSLMKLYMIGFLISSGFIIHSNFRPCVSTVETLETAFGISQLLQDKIQIDFPKVAIAVRDCVEFKVKGPQDEIPATEKFRQLLKSFFTSTASEEYCKFLDSLEMKGKPPYSTIYLQTQDPMYLYDTLISEWNQALIKQFATLKKRLPGSDDYMTFKDFKRMIEMVSTTINSNDFRDIFHASVDAVTTSAVEPIVKSFVAETETEAIALSNFEDTKTALEDFRVKVNVFQQQKENELKSAAEAKSRRKVATCSALDHQLKQANLLIVSTVAKAYTNFAQRRALAEKDQKAQDQAKEAQQSYAKLQEETTKKLQDFQADTLNRQRETEQRLLNAQTAHNAQIEDLIRQLNDASANLVSANQRILSLEQSRNGGGGCTIS